MRHISVKVLALITLVTGLGVLLPDLAAQDKPVFDPNFHIYLLIGQSNMEGAPRPEAMDMEENSRIKVLAYTDSPRQKREYNKWSVASPPLHSAYQGVGPGDWFAKTLIKDMPANVTIGLVPCAINGVDIDFFMKDTISKRRKEFKIPPDNHWDGAYAFVLERAKLAQQYGVIKGILFHQGESDYAAQRPWLTKLAKMTADLRADLGIPDLPILAGEMLQGGASESLNNVMKNLPAKIPGGYVISSEGLKGIDRFHFDLAGQRELGKRYAEKMRELLK